MIRHHQPKHRAQRVPEPRLTSSQRQLLAKIDDLAEQACADSIRFNRDGRPGRAEYAVTRAGMKIARLVKDHNSVEQLGELVLFEPFRDARLGDTTSPAPTGGAA